MAEGVLDSSSIIAGAMAPSGGRYVSYKGRGGKEGLHFPEFFSQFKELWLNECSPGLANGVEEMRGPLSPGKTGQGHKESQ